MPRERQKPSRTALLGNLSLQGGSRSALAAEQVQLLEAIAETDSITAAAKRVDIDSSASP